MKIAELLGDKIHLGMALTDVADAGENGIKLGFGDGSQVYADKVILAIPCPVYTSIDFNGVLPEDRVSAIRGVGYGKNAKIMVPLLSQHQIRVINSRAFLWKSTDSEVLLLYYSGHASLFTEKQMPVLCAPEFDVLNFVTKDAVPLPDA